MKFTKAIISLSLASLALAATSKQLRSVDGDRDGTRGDYICCYNDVNSINNDKNCDIYPDNFNRDDRIDYRCVPSEDLIQLLDNNFRVEPNGDGGRDGPLRIVLSKIDRDFGQGRNNGRVGSGNSVGLLGGLDGVLSSLGL